MTLSERCSLTRCAPACCSLQSCEDEIGCCWTFTLGHSCGKWLTARFVCHSHLPTVASESTEAVAHGTTGSRQRPLRETPRGQLVRRIARAVSVGTAAEPKAGCASSCQCVAAAALALCPHGPAPIPLGLEAGPSARPVACHRPRSPGGPSRRSLNEAHPRAWPPATSPRRLAPTSHLAWALPPGLRRWPATARFPGRLGSGQRPAGGRA